MSNPASKTYLFIVNDAQYGNERPYNAMRLALAGIVFPDGFEK